VYEKDRGPQLEVGDWPNTARSRCVEARNGRLQVVVDLVLIRVGVLVHVATLHRPLAHGAFSVTPREEQHSIQPSKTSLKLRRTSSFTLLPPFCSKPVSLSCDSLGGERGCCSR